MARKRLTEAEKKEIRKLSESGHTQPGLAVRFGVSTRTIYRILHPEYYEKELARSMEYQRENTEKIRANRATTRRDYKLSFGHKQDAEIIEHLDKQDNVNSYIRDLIVEDMKS